MQEILKNNSNIFERMMQIASENGCRNTNDLAKLLGYRSPEKLYRLERDKNAKPSVDILSDFANLFENSNINWLLTDSGNKYITQKNTYSPQASSRVSIVSEPENTFIAPPNKTKLAPATAPATAYLGMPKVITVNENNDELVSLVNVKAAAGYLNGYGDSEYIEKLPTIRLPNLRGGTHRAFELKGHSMSPTMHNQSIAIGRWVESLDDIRDRRIYIVVSKTEGIVFKRVLNRISETGKLILLSDNQNKREYPNIILDPEDVSELWYLRAGFIFEFPEANELNNRVNDLEAKYTLLADQMQKMLK